MTADAAPYDPRTAAPYPLMETLGYRVAEWEVGRAVVELEIEALHANRHGIPHGGIHALLMDTAAGFAGSRAPEGAPNHRCMTLSLNVNFIALPRGSRLIAEAKVTGGGMRTYFTAMEVRDETGLLVANGTATCRRRDGTGDPRKAAAG